MNRGQLRQSVLDILARRDTDVVNLLDSAINRVKLRMMRAFNYAAMEAQSGNFIYPGSSTGIPMPVADMKEPIDLIVLSAGGSGTPLRRVSYAQWRNEQEDSEFPGGDRMIEPLLWRTRWMLFDNQLALVPPPSSDLNLVLAYYRFLPDYTQDTDSDFFSNTGADALVSGTLREWYQIQNEFDLAQLHERDFVIKSRELQQLESYSALGGMRLAIAG